MGSSCGKAVEGPDVDCVHEGIAELKKQTQFTEQWKRKYDVRLICYFTSVSRLCTKPMPIIKGCKGIIVVKILIRNNDPRHPKLSSILHSPVLQWHGIDIKLQLPKFLPLNLWEGEHTSYAFYHPETATNRGFCTVTGKIGQEQILLQEELRFGNPVPLDEWKSLSKDLEGHMEKYLKTTRKKIRTSADRTSQRDSHDTGYTSEQQQQPYPTLRYSEHDTDSDQDHETQRQKDQRSKARRKDTPHYGRPIIKGSPKGFNIPLIEELEMNQDSSDDIADQCGSKEGVSEEMTESIGGNDHDAVFKRSRKMSFINKRKSSSRSISHKTSEDRGAVPKRKSRSLVDISHLPDHVREMSPSVEVASYHSAEKCVVRQRRKKKSLTSKLMKEKSTKVDVGMENQEENTAGAKLQGTSIDDAHDADDEDEYKRMSRENSQNEHAKINACQDKITDGDQMNRSNSGCTHLNKDFELSAENIYVQQTSCDEDAIDKNTKEAVKSDTQAVFKQAFKVKRVVEIFKEHNKLSKGSNGDDAAEIIMPCRDQMVVDAHSLINASTENDNDKLADIESNITTSTTPLQEQQDQTGKDEMVFEKQESVSDEVKLKKVALTVDRIRKLQNIAAAFSETQVKSSSAETEETDTKKPKNALEIEQDIERQSMNETQQGVTETKCDLHETEMYDSVLPDQGMSYSYQLLSKSPVRPKAESFSATQRRSPSPRKHNSLCNSEMKAQFVKMREGKSSVKPPLSGAKSFCEEN